MAITINENILIEAAVICDDCGVVNCLLKADIRKNKSNKPVAPPQYLCKLSNETPQITNQSSKISS